MITYKLSVSATTITASAIGSSSTEYWKQKLILKNLISDTIFELDRRDTLVVECHQEVLHDQHMNALLLYYIIYYTIPHPDTNMCYVLYTVQFGTTRLPTVLHSYDTIFRGCKNSTVPALCCGR